MRRGARPPTARSPSADSSTKVTSSATLAPDIDVSAAKTRPSAPGRVDASIDLGPDPSGKLATDAPAPAFPTATPDLEVSAVEVRSLTPIEVDVPVNIGLIPSNEITADAPAAATSSDTQQSESHSGDDHLYVHLPLVNEFVVPDNLPHLGEIMRT